MFQLRLHGAQCGDVWGARRGAAGSTLMARGDHLAVDRGLYTHHGIDLGDGTVVHLTGEPLTQDDAAVRRTSRASFAAGARIRRVRCDCARHDVERTVRRALSMLGDTRYELATWNCEHFARWARCDSARSTQVETMVTVLGGPAAGVAVRCMGELGAPPASSATSTRSTRPRARSRDDAVDAAGEAAATAVLVAVGGPPAALAVPAVKALLRLLG